MMFTKINLNLCSSVKSFIVIVVICLAVPCNVAFDDFARPVISRTSGLNVLLHMFGMPTYKHHIITSFLDVNDVTKGLFQLVKIGLRRCVFRIWKAKSKKIIRNKRLECLMSITYQLISYRWEQSICLQRLTN